ncbi:homocysteine S-methyltransferase [Streptomyces spiramenti]|uniref:Homocysteine S-methyltransferase n=1 Tax=Streptomyces spiramenti TaxID=2720606 RepID=A0ABX1AK36_9ACTN|nr:homocysteine S-methyltransferase [Streptomyces spiramenti]NJP65743.1 homocysteine S-methyltransferase [Streptomyces spiramenti]
MEALPDPRHPGPPVGDRYRSPASALAAGALPLDGGLAAELAVRGADLSGPLWTARLLLEDPAVVTACHAAFLAAGARVLTTAGYQLSPAGLTRRGLSAEEAAGVAAEATAVARAVARRATEQVWVAASVGPLGAVRADGGEYRGGYGLSEAELVRFHLPRVEAAAAGGPDVLALETVPDAREARAMLTAAEAVGVPVWLSYTVAGGRTRAGQPLAEAFAVAAGRPGVVAVGVNCCDPAEVTPALRIAAAVTGLPGVAYPNSGERWDADRGWHGPVTRTAASVADWYASGARLIGGCCRVGARELAPVAAAVRRLPPPGRRGR